MDWDVSIGSVCNVLQLHPTFMPPSDWLDWHLGKGLSISSVLKAFEILMRIILLSPGPQKSLGGVAFLLCGFLSITWFPESSEPLARKIGFCFPILCLTLPLTVPKSKAKLWEKGDRKYSWGSTLPSWASNWRGNFPFLRVLGTYGCCCDFPYQNGIA